MAIAYYIPDPSKLAEPQKPKPKVIKNIKIPLNHYTLSNSTCWELIAQIFCYALRYHNLSAGNGILQISIELSQQPQEFLHPNPSASGMAPNGGHGKN